MTPVIGRRSQQGTGAGTNAQIPVPSGPRHESEDWHVLCTAHPNLLVEGSESAVEATIFALTPHLAHPIHSWQPTSPLELDADAEGTLVLRDVDQLASGQQERLLQWFDARRARVQVIATASRPLFALVEGGTFLADLYYRLNVVCLDLAAD
jgi:transcriptional regulator of acetoin/glycerol metabolism